MEKSQKYILWFREIDSNDVPLVGGKNASLGEMFSKFNEKGSYPVEYSKVGAKQFDRINIPNGFVVTSKAFWYFLQYNKIDNKIKDIFKKFNPKSIKSLEETGKTIRNLILK